MMETRSNTHCHLPSSLLSPHMSATASLVNLIATQDPAFHEMLRTRDVPSDWKPDPEMTAQVLANMKRNQCRTCGNEGAPSMCSACRVARYCSVECQRLDWEPHKKVCDVDRLAKAALKELQHKGHPDEA